MNLTLVRHTSLDLGSSICYGQSDVDVSAEFNAERQVLQTKLAKFTFDAIYTSPLQRCHKLAKALCADASLGFAENEIQLDDRLKELHFGDWEMQPWNAISRETFDIWANDYVHLAPPNGETFSQLHARTKEFLAEVSNHSHGKNILVITHGGFIRSLVAEVLNMSLQDIFKLSIDYASVTQLEFKNAIPKVRCINL